MADQKKQTLDLETLQAMQTPEVSASDSATKGLSELNSLSGTIRSAQDWLAGKAQSPKHNGGFRKIL